MKNKYKRDVHHRLSRACGGTDHFPANNMIRVPRRKHVAYHRLFPGDMCLCDIVKQLNEVWIDPRYKLVIEKREEKPQHVRGQLKLPFP